MADRDFDTFASHVDEGAVFINGGKPLRGKVAVLVHWKKFFESSEAPFAWKPEIAEVSASNGLGYTEGPVSIPDGRVVTTFFTTWKQQADGTWRVVFDNGHDVCNCPQQP
jgi:ketosteroid isomerase-like protein